MKIVASFFSSNSKCANCSKKFSFNKRRICSSCSKSYSEFLFCQLCSIKVKKHPNSELSRKAFCVVCYMKQAQPVEISREKKQLNATARLVHIRASSDPRHKKNSNLSHIPSFSELPSNKVVNFKQIEDIKEGLFIRENKPKDFYKFIRKIGKGGSSKVYLCKNKSNSEYVAIKKIKIPNEKVKKQLVNEILIAGSCSNSNIIAYHESFIYNGYLYVVMELMQGNLCQFISDNKSTVQESLISYILREILRGIQLIHSNFRVHRDIKSDNILISRNGEIKLADFGFSAQLTLEEDKRLTIVGTPCWMAPELFSDTGYGCKIDIWSLGIIALELANGEPPRMREDTYKIMAMISALPPPSLDEPGKWSNYFSDFLEKCLNKDEALRWNASQLLKHPFLFVGSEEAAQDELRKWVKGMNVEIFDFKIVET